MKFLKFFENFEVLNEAQILNMDKKKEDFIKLFTDIKREIENGREPFRKGSDDCLEELFYSMMTNFSSGLSFSLDDDLLKRSEKLIKFLEPEWKKRFNDDWVYDDGKQYTHRSEQVSSWQRFFINQSNSKLAEDDITHNYYLTINNEANNVRDFYNNFGNLWSSLVDFSNNKKIPIHFKFPRELKRFISHNDNLKFYIYDNWETGKKSNINDLKVVVDNLLKSNNIKTSIRTHNLAFDSKKYGTFGQILSKLLTYAVVNTIKENRDKQGYTTEKLYDATKKNLEKLLSQFNTLSNDPAKLIEYIENAKKSASY